MNADEQTQQKYTLAFVVKLEGVRGKIISRKKKVFMVIVQN